MVHWMAWGVSALSSRLFHVASANYYKKYIQNGFEHYLVNIYLLILVTFGKLFVNSSFNMNATVIAFGLTNTLYPYWINKAYEILPDSSYSTLITHSDPIILTTITPLLINSENRLPILFPIYCMTIGKLLIIYYDNPYMRIAVDDESLQEELQQPILNNKVLTNKYIGFSSISLLCIVTKDVLLGHMSLVNVDISDIIFTHQLFAFLLSLVYKQHNNIEPMLTYYDDIGDSKQYIISTIMLFNNGIVNYFYIASLYYCYSNIPNIGYAKMMVSFYVPCFWCYRLGISERECNEYYIGSYYCYFLGLFGLLYFGR